MPWRTATPICSISTSPPTPKSSTTGWWPRFVSATAIRRQWHVRSNATATKWPTPTVRNSPMTRYSSHASTNSSTIWNSDSPTCIRHNIFLTQHVISHPYQLFTYRQTIMKIAIFGKRRQSPDDIRHIQALLDRLSELDIFVSVDRHFFEAMSPQFRPDTRHSADRHRHKPPHDPHRPLCSHRHNPPPGQRTRPQPQPRSQRMGHLTWTPHTRHLHTRPPNLTIVTSALPPGPPARLHHIPWTGPSHRDEPFRSLPPAVWHILFRTWSRAYQVATHLPVANTAMTWQPLHHITCPTSYLTGSTAVSSLPNSAPYHTLSLIFSSF